MFQYSLEIERGKPKFVVHGYGGKFYNLGENLEESIKLYIEAAANVQYADIQIEQVASTESPITSRQTPNRNNTRIK
jgi:hypothetical protein